MNWQQIIMLLISSGTLVVIIGLFFKFGKYAQTIDNLDKKFDKIDEKFDRVETKYDRIETKFEKIEERFDKIDEKFDKVDEKFAKVDEKFDKVDEKFDKMDEKFSKMDEKMERGFSDLRQEIRQGRMEAMFYLTANPEFLKKMHEKEMGT